MLLTKTQGSRSFVWRVSRNKHTADRSAGHKKESDLMPPTGPLRSPWTTRPLTYCSNLCNASEEIQIMNTVCKSRNSVKFH